MNTRNGLRALYMIVSPDATLLHNVCVYAIHPKALPPERLDALYGGLEYTACFHKTKRKQTLCIIRVSAAARVCFLWNSQCCCGCITLLGPMEGLISCGRARQKMFGLSISSWGLRRILRFQRPYLTRSSRMSANTPSRISFGSRSARATSLRYDCMPSVSKR